MNVGKSSGADERKTWRFVRWLPTWYYALKSGTVLDPAFIAIIVLLVSLLTPSRTPGLSIGLLVYFFIFIVSAGLYMSARDRRTGGAYTHCCPRTVPL